MRFGLYALVGAILLFGFLTGPNPWNRVAQAPRAVSEAPRVTSKAPTVSVLSGQPSATVRTGETFSFQPNYSGSARGLTFAATNLPAWATIDAATGRIHGTPSSGDVGTYVGVSISIADAAHSATQAFDITVIGSGSGVAKLDWQAPVTKFDGSSLDDLAGYRILYGRNPDDLDHSVFVADPAAHSYEFATLDKGAWYFAIVGVSADGLEGPATVPAMKVI